MVRDITRVLNNVCGDYVGYENQILLNEMKLLTLSLIPYLSVVIWQVIQMFRGCKLEDMPPHIYAAAQTAYRSMQSTRMDQSIVFTGRSGGGKTWNVRHVLQYLTIVSGTHHNVVTGNDRIQDQYCTWMSSYIRIVSVFLQLVSPTCLCANYF